jgi:riboflavin biosynthesis pyrimidine reductase
MVGAMLSQLPLSAGERAEAIESDTIAERIAREDRTPPPGRPWVAVNMVTSADGATAIGGVSGRLGSTIDSVVFHALRGIADVVLAGSRTVTAERYRPPKPSDAMRGRRVERGQAPSPRLAVVSNRGDIDLELPLFGPAADGRTPIVLVASGSITDERRQQVSDVADVIESGDSTVDLGSALGLLHERHEARVVVCEGGSVLNGLLLGGDLVDEWCITIAPMLVSGGSTRAAIGPLLPDPATLRLDRAWLNGSELLLRYLRDRTGSTR